MLLAQQLYQITLLRVVFLVLVLLAQQRQYQQHIQLQCCINSSGNKYVINGTQQPTLSLIRGNTYVFDWSDSTAQGHPVRFSTTSDGTHIIVDLSTPQGVTKDDSAYKTTIVVSGDAPDNLYYYCQIHSGMGGAINVSSTASVTIETSITELVLQKLVLLEHITPESIYRRDKVCCMKLVLLEQKVLKHQ